MVEFPQWILAAMQEIREKRICRRAKGGQYSVAKTKVNPFYDSMKWKYKRIQILKRDGFLCQECKKYGRYREAKEVHHIKHLEDYPELALDNDNLISLCKACHNKQHKEKGGWYRY